MRHLLGEFARAARARTLDGGKKKLLNQTVIPAVFALIGVVLGVGLQYVSGRALEGRRQLAVQKSSAYGDFFKAVALIAQHGDSRDNRAMAAEAKVRVCIYGSPRVIKHLSEFEKTGAVIGSPKSAAIITELLKEMRKDAGTDSQGISEDDLGSILFGPNA